MRFSNGYWMVKQDYVMSYATQCVRVTKSDKELQVLSACRPVNHRGDVLDGGTLTVNFTAPRKNVIRVKVTHFAGTKVKEPRFETYEEEVQPVIHEGEDFVSFTSGELTARVLKAKGQWQVDYMVGDRVLTTSGFRAMGRALKKDNLPSSLLPNGKSYMVESLMLDVGENVYGLGERFGAYVKNGQTVDMWNADGGTASELAYKNIPFYMTNRGYGVLVEDASDVSFEVASEKVERVQFSHEGESMTYDIIYGETPKGTLDIYTALTGRPALLPAWSFGLWLSTSFTTNYDEETTSSFIGGMAERDIPLSVFHFDCYWMKAFNWCDFAWDPDTFPDPEGMLKRYHDKGLHLCCWINPYIGQASPLFEEGMKHGYLIKKTNGDVWQTDMWQAGMGILDVTNPAARDWYCSYLRKLLDMGIDCFKTDFGERIPVRDIAYFDGSDPLRMHNYYTFLYNQMVFDLLKEVRGEGEAILFARSATVGGQQFPVHWGGDNSASYVSMAETLRAGLSMSHSGFGYWSHDISGFESTAPADVYKRWCQFGVFSSHSRLHGSTSYRVPWLFDEESSDVLRKFVKLKCRLMPYLYGAAVEAHEHGIPMMRPMMLEFYDDPACETLDRQYMMGESILVAPIFRKDGQVQYYLPDGLWTCLLTGDKVQGGHWQTEIHDFMSMPLMVRPGSVIPMGSRDDRPDYDYTDGLELHVFQLEDGAEVDVTVPDLKGHVAAVYHVKKEHGQVQVQTDCQKPFSVVIHE
ncbi:MAG: alpha-xylosidase [Clostridia bacterium]|nr:alpha-xylosidase [Clostridia bacterium]